MHFVSFQLLHYRSTTDPDLEKERERLFFSHSSCLKMNQSLKQINKEKIEKLMINRMDLYSATREKRNI